MVIQARDLNEGGAIDHSEEVVRNIVVILGWDGSKLKRERMVKEMCPCAVLRRLREIKTQEPSA